MDITPPGNLAATLFGAVWANYKGMIGMEEGKFFAVRCGEIRSLLRNACQELGIIAAQKNVASEVSTYTEPGSFP